jgi:hypothetical protein
MVAIDVTPAGITVRIPRRDIGLWRSWSEEQRRTFLQSIDQKAGEKS